MLDRLMHIKQYNHAFEMNWRCPKLIVWTSFASKFPFLLIRIWSKGWYEKTVKRTLLNFYSYKNAYSQDKMSVEFRKVRFLNYEKIGFQKFTFWEFAYSVSPYERPSGIGLKWPLQNGILKKLIHSWGHFWSYFFETRSHLEKMFNIFEASFEAFFIKKLQYHWPP